MEKFSPFMNSFKKFPLLWLLLLANGALCLTIQGASVDQFSWYSQCAHATVPAKLLEPPFTSPTNTLPLVIYLENLAAPRVGTESDEEILNGFLTNRMRVLILDYQHASQARVPWLNKDLFELRKAVQTRGLIPGYSIDKAHVYLVPSGCNLKQNVVYDRETDRSLALDIIYPAHPAQPVGAVLEFSCDNVNRMGNASLVICSDTILDGEATEGIAVAMADHPVKAPYKGLDPMPECCWIIKAAVRTLRVEGRELGLNGRIAMDGFSRGSGMALMLVTTMGMPEFEGHGLNTGESSDVQGAVVMSGRFTYLQILPKDHMLPRYNAAWGDLEHHRGVWKREGAMDYLDQATLPLFLTINCGEGPDAQFQMTVLRQKLAVLGSDEIFMMDHEKRGHKVTLVPEILDGINRYFKSRLDADNQ